MFFSHLEDVPQGRLAEGCIPSAALYQKMADLPSTSLLVISSTESPVNTYLLNWLFLECVRFAIVALGSLRKFIFLLLWITCPEIGLTCVDIPIASHLGITQSSLLVT